MRLLAILIFLLSGCNGTGSVSPDASTFYKRDIRIAVAGHTYYGVAVLPSKARYTLDMEFSGTLDLFTFTDCHQQIARERAGNGGIFGPKNQIRIDIMITGLAKTNTLIGIHWVLSSNFLDSVLSTFAVASRIVPPLPCFKGESENVPVSKYPR